MRWGREFTESIRFETAIKSPLQQAVEEGSVSVEEVREKARRPWLWSLGLRTCSCQQLHVRLQAHTGVSRTQHDTKLCYPVARRVRCEAWMRQLTKPAGSLPHTRFLMLFPQTMTCASAGLTRTYITIPGSLKSCTCLTGRPGTHHRPARDTGGRRRVGFSMVVCDV